MHKFILGLVAFGLALPNNVAAQDDMGLIVVTSSRSDRDDFNEYYDDEQSAIGLTRKADYFVKPIYINSDSRDATLRKTELFAMLRATIEQASHDGISLVAGSYTLKRLTLANMDDLPIRSGNRPDTSRVQIYARIPITGTNRRASAADDQIGAFVKRVPVTGRSFIETQSTELAISNPDQYRVAVVKAIADEAKRYAGLFGSDYGVEIRGLDSELFWQQASDTEVFLYIEHNFVIKPK